MVDYAPFGVPPAQPQDAAPAQSPFPPEVMAMLLERAKSLIQPAPAPSAADQAAMSPETYANPMVSQMIGSLATLPKRAIEEAGQDFANRGTGAEPQSIGPALEAAMLPMGTGAIAGVPVRAGEQVLGSGAIRARYDKALADGKITPSEHAGFVEALTPSAEQMAQFSGKQPKISDIVRETGLPKEEVHRWLLDEAKAGRVTLHPTTSVDLPPGVAANALHLPGFKEPFVNAYFKPVAAVRPEPPRVKNFFAGDTLTDLGETAEKIWQQNKGKMSGVNDQLERMRTLGVSREDWTADQVAQIEALIKEKAKSPFVNQARLDRTQEKAADKMDRNIGSRRIVREDKT